jgi:hypothetical protein
MCSLNRMFLFLRNRGAEGGVIPKQWPADEPWMQPDYKGAYWGDSSLAIDDASRSL